MHIQRRTRLNRYDSFNIFSTIGVVAYTALQTRLVVQFDMIYSYLNNVKKLEKLRGHLESIVLLYHSNLVTLTFWWNFRHWLRLELDNLWCSLRRKFRQNDEISVLVYLRNYDAFNPANVE